ncbi:uncharacterized protein [Venturia canescens]|uniref:uncharacterized protein isoform X4 n=1 Tax=Venturia canescens TaxID=32260 RepID=UPI001C9BFF58|nr:uncharacterized protein LOC122412269 isoform X4 [Venturia canescens]
MPYYHSFGWYYFAKYIFGLAGMIYLYTGIFKEKSIVCPCPAEERQLQQRKESKRPVRCSCSDQLLCSDSRACGCKKRKRVKGLGKRQRRV